MAYGVIIRASAATAEGTHTVEILRDGHTGQEHIVHAGAPFYTEEYGSRGADLDADIRPSQVTANLVITDAAALAAVRGTLSAESREYRLTVRHGPAIVWQGYVLPVTSVTRLDDGTQGVRVVAKDRARSLDDQAFVGPGGAVYEGRSSLGEIVERELTYTGLGITGHEFAGRFRPAGESDPYAVEVDQARFYTREDDETVALSRGEVVRSILESQQAQLTQWRGAWHTLTPHAAPNAFTVAEWIARSDELSGEPASRQGRSTYLVGEVATAIRNGSFEAGITHQQGIPGGPAFEWENVERHETDISLDGVAVGSIPVRETDTPLTEAQARARQTESGYQLVPVVPGAGELTFGVNFNVDIRYTDGRVVRAEGTKGYVYASFRLVGQDLYYDEDSDSWVSGSRRVLLGAPFAFSIWAHREITLPQVPAGDDLEVRLLGAVLDHPLSDGELGQIGETRTLFDLVSLKAELDQGEQSITYTSFSPTASEGETAEVDILIGDGPFEGALGAMRLPSGDLTSDWRVGSETRTVPHAQILAEHLMRTRGKGRRRVRLTTIGPVPGMAPVRTMHLDGIDYWPTYMSIEWPRGQATIEAIELIDVPVPAGLRQAIETRPRTASGASGDAWRVYEDLSGQGFVTEEAGDARYLRKTGGTLTGDLVFSGGGRLRGEDDELHVYAEDGSNHGVLTVGVLRVLDHVDSYQTDILEVEDQYVKVNRGQPHPDLNGGLIVERGAVDSYLEFDEGRDRWGWRMGADLNDGTFRAFVDEDRSISAGTGLTGGGTLAQNRQFALTGQALALHNLGTTGLIGRTSGGSIVSRSIATGGSGLSVANGNASSGNPTLSLSDRLQGVHGAANGILVGTTGGAVSRTIQGTANQVNVLNGNGANGNPVLSLPQDIHTGAVPEFAGGTYTGDVAGQRGWIDRRIEWAATDQDVYLLIGPIDTSSPGSNLSGVFTGARATSSGGAGVVQIRVAYRRISGSTSHRVSADILDSTILGDDVRLYDVVHGGERWVALSFTGISSHVSPDSMTFSGLAENVEIKSVLGSEVTNAQPILGDGKYTLNAPMAQFLGQGRFTDFLTLDKQASSGNHALRADRTLRIQGTSNRISVSNDSALNLTSDRTWQITAPQDLHTDSQFMVGTLRAKIWAGSPDFTSRLKGWRVTAAGNADFRHIYADELTVQAFTADVAQALVGSDYLTKSRATLASSFEAPATVGATATLHVEDLEELGAMAVFEDGDTLRLRYVSREGGGLIVRDVWGTVAGYSDQQDGTQTWTFTRRGSAEADQVIHKGAVALDYGKPGDSLIVRTVLDQQGSPYERMMTWWDDDEDHVPDRYEVITQIGRLTGLSHPGVAQMQDGIFAAAGYLTKEVIIGGAGLSIDSFQQRPTALWHFDGNLVDSINGATPEGYEDAEVTDYGLVTGPGLVATLRKDGKFGGGVAVEEGTTNLHPDPLYYDSVGVNSYEGNTCDVEIVTIDGIPTLHIYNVVQPTNISYPRVNQKTLTALINAGEIFTTSARVKSTGGGTVIFSYYNESSSTTRTFVVNPTSEWQTYTNTTNVPDGSNLNRQYIRVDEGAEYWIQLIQIEKKPFATSFTEGTRAHGRLSIPAPSPQQGTVATWVRVNQALDTITDAASSPRIIQLGHYDRAVGNSNLNLWIYRQSGNPPRLLLYASGDGSDGWSPNAGGVLMMDAADTEAAFFSGEPAHVAVTWENHDTINVYVNGSQVGTTRVLGDPFGSEWGEANELRLGDSGSPSSQPNSTYSNLATFDYALSAAEIRRIALSDAPIQERPSQVRITGEQILVGTDTLIKDGFIKTSLIDAQTILAQRADIGGWQIETGKLTGGSIELLSSGKIWQTDNRWALNDDGSGRLANGAITWNADGDVTFGSGVTLSWDSVDGRPEDLSDLDPNASGAISAHAGQISSLGNSVDTLSNNLHNTNLRTANVQATYISSTEIRAPQITGNTGTIGNVQIGSTLSLSGSAGGTYLGSDASNYWRGLRIVGGSTSRFAELVDREVDDGQISENRPQLRLQRDSNNYVESALGSDDQFFLIHADGKDVLSATPAGLDIDGSLTVSEYIQAGNLTSPTGTQAGTYIDSSGNLGSYLDAQNYIRRTAAGLSIRSSDLQLRSGSQAGQYMGLSNSALYFGAQTAGGGDAAVLLNRNGGGFVANQNLSWDTDGNMTLGGFIRSGAVKVGDGPGFRGLAVEGTIGGNLHNIINIGDHTPQILDLSEQAPITHISQGTSGVFNGTWQGTVGSQGMLGGGTFTGSPNGPTGSRTVQLPPGLEGRLVRIRLMVTTNLQLWGGRSQGYSIWLLGRRFQRLAYDPTNPLPTEGYYTDEYETEWFAAPADRDVDIQFSGNEFSGDHEGIQYTLAVDVFNEEEMVIDISPGSFNIYDAWGARGLFFDEDGLRIMASEITSGGSPLMRWRGTVATMNDRGGLTDVREGDMCRVAENGNIYIRSVGGWHTL